MPSPGSERGEATRQSILAAARELILRQGYHGTTVRQIAQRAGIVPAAVYNHFLGKEQIYLALLQDANVYPAVAAALQVATGDSVEALLRDAAHRLVAALAEHDEMVPLLFVDILEFEGRNVASLAAEGLLAVMGLFQRLLALDPGRRIVKPIPVEVFVRTFFGLFLSYYMTRRLFGRLTDSFRVFQPEADLVDDFVDVFAYGVLQGSTHKGEEHGCRDNG